ncbi:hypothetical protein Pla175_35980 [Pirellulimonas nuda]|uniref:Zinc-finger domain-containing protein n=1 Tax=Pirellulimonas nuda TaxID=2528009 RepID=A0A518DFF9_9BACT|nr:hypothetical protein [Pirellulimonas nuda]QDU90196.1 hypothetical protein Pla175_35980 [Pirellulimonas nuda]
MPTTQPTPNGSGRNDSGWSKCPPGALVATGARLRSAERGRRLRAATLGASLCGTLAVCVALGLLWSDRSAVKEIVCSACTPRFAQYAAHLQGAPMDAAEAAAVAHHLSYCPLCRPKFQQQYPGLLTEASRERHPHYPLAQNAILGK